MVYDIHNDIVEIIKRLNPEFAEFRNKSICITGGTGFFGKWLLEILCYLNEVMGYEIKIYVVTRNIRLFLESDNNHTFKSRIRFIEGDVRSFSLEKIKIDYLIHMATTAAAETFGGQDQLDKLDLLYAGTRHALQEAVNAGVSKVLFTSSGVAYGPSSGEFFAESHLTAPQTNLVSSALGEGKRVAEYLIAYYSDRYDYQYSIARCFSFFGPYLPLDIHYAIGNFVNDALTKSEIIVKGGGNELRSYLYIADAWSWLLKLMLNVDNQIYNVGSSKAISIGDLAKLIRDIICPSKSVRILGLEHDIGNFNRNVYVPNNQKICEKFDLDEWTPLDIGIRKWIRDVVNM